MEANLSVEWGYRASRVAFSFVSVSLLVLLPLTTPVTGAPLSDIQVVSQSVKGRFPDELAFTIVVRSDAGDIADAALFYQVGWEEVERVGRPDPFTPATEVTFTHVWKTSGETVPPFVEVSYYWRIIDSAGNAFTTAPMRTEYADHTHDWQSQGDERVIVYWYDQPADFGAALFEATAEGYNRIASVTGITTERPARVVVYNNRRDFCAFYAPHSCQDWVGGQTFDGITVQQGTDRDWLTYEVVPHELAHIFCNEVFRDTWVQVPIWFNEGVAVYNERTDHSREMNLVIEAAAEGELIALRHMGTQASGLAHGDIGLWYAETCGLVAFIVDVHGEQKLGEVVLTLADNHPMEEALQQVLGTDLIEFEMAWREWLGYPVDVIPTPIVMPPMTIAPIPLPSAPRGRPAATATRALPTPTAALPTPTPTGALPTSTPAPVGMPLSSPCCLSATVMVLVVLAYVSVRAGLLGAG